MSNELPPMSPGTSSAAPPIAIAYAGADHNAIDASHLSALSICHFIWGGLLALFSCLGIFYIVLGGVITSGRIPMTTPGGPPQPFDDRAFGIIFIIMGAVVLLLGWGLAGCTIASAVFIRRRTRRMFSIVVAGLNCALFPFGTTLGVFALIILLRESVRQEYLQRAGTVAR